MRALLLALIGLTLIPAAAHATPPGEEGRIVVHPRAGEGTLALIDPVPDSVPFLPPALADAGEVAGSPDGHRLAAAMVIGNDQVIALAKHDGTNVTADGDDRSHTGGATSTRQRRSRSLSGGL